jgi:hypothetical protein
MHALELLPARIAEKSISQEEIVLPMIEALEAINFLEAKGLLILGWEGWVKTADGRIGHGSAPQGTVSLENLSVEGAAQYCRETIQQDAARWLAENPETTHALHFCITVCE